MTELKETLPKQLYDKLYRELQEQLELQLLQPLQTQQQIAKRLDMHARAEKEIASRDEEAFAKLQVKGEGRVHACMACSIVHAMAAGED